ncbi:MAG: hypothetical protein LKJ18_06415 [Ancrocorticia sp.]|nr:hypothetical protein [Ancrocorticia sp.]MCI2002106.1 hypothetical protein [Ancrocorticia sp.]MCI2029720.1 hypothetical protein [Ancrocorticia sp.]
MIFKDIDRFNDSHIFEPLRALNTLLNASPQIGKVIRLSKSNLDTLCKLSRALVIEKIKQIEGDRRAPRQTIAGKSGAGSCSSRLGKSLIVHLE